MKPRLLIVEDEPHLCELYALEFGEEGYDALCVHTVAAAREALAAGPCAAVILDVQLPGCSGLELLDEIKQKGAAGCPVVLFSAYATHRESRAGQLADAVLTKSGNLTELKDTVRRIISTTAPPAA